MNKCKYTSRELQVLAYVAEGEGNKEIAVLMGLNRKTIGNYTIALYAKTYARNREELFKMARKELGYDED